MNISVLVSLFEKENVNHFEKAMKSVWDDQTRRPDEIVLVEDGIVTGELYNAVKKWKEKLGNILILVILKENVGLARALNEGIKHCTGDYIARMDTDDISLPKRFELQEKFLDTHPDIFLLGSAVIEIDERGNYMNERIMPLSLEEIKKVMPRTCPFVHPSVIFRREIFNEGLLYSEKCRRYQDIELWYRIVLAGYKVANTQEVLVKYRKGAFLYKKRKQFAHTEFKIYMNGIYHLYGLFSWKYVYPIIHYLFRLLPPSWCHWIYIKFIAKYWNNLR
jgi:glycosyltransferase involved in cell wall biosynthesis